ncbi:hypothetical protein V9T40_011481 [Parthenolecanium corni]|uniref:Growth hormone-inducible transmembrane protein n=1 Tax=Parthenolecanium corni TaxID=536013 RepID=A0AAN9T652_9HEMI
MIILKVLSGTHSGLCSNFSRAAHNPSKVFLTRVYSQQSRETIWKSARARRRAFTETVSKPVGDTAFTIGRGAVAGGAIFGLGSLCYYGLGLSNEVGTLETSRIWPQYVRNRIHDTYMYFGSSIAITAASAVTVFRSPVMMNLVMKNSWLAIGGTIVAMMGSGILAQSIEYSPGFGPKQMAWILHSAVMGAVIAPVCLVGGPILLRAAVYTAGIVGGLSTVAVCAPSDKFLTMGGPLAIGLGVVFASSIGSAFLPPTTALGAGLMSMSLYGGLLLFSGFMLYDTQRIIRKAETHPLYGVQPYDPINAAISIYLDTMNIFIRMVMILASGNNRKR